MLEKPTLTDDALLAALRQAYGLPARSVEFLPIGNDSTAWAYRAQVEDGTPYFLKVKRGAINRAALSVPHFLRDSGIGEVVAPLPARDGALWMPAGDFTLILYPFIAGHVGMDVGLTDAQWVAYGAFLKRLHTAHPPADLLAQVRRETFVPAWGGRVHTLQAQIAAGGFADPYRRALAAFWHERRAEIGRIAARAEELGRALQARSREFVLCHADIHTANILLDAAGGLHVVDWDEVILAPRERDLMFVVGTSIGGLVAEGSSEALFFAGYGNTAVDPLALAYYRYEWVVQEIGDYGERVFLLDDLGAETKADSVRGFRQLFDPGDVVDGAYESECVKGLQQLQEKD